MSLSRSLVRCAWVPVAATLLASCAGTPPARHDAADRASYMAHAGKPVDRFMWLTSYRRWTSISADQVVVWTDLDRAYLVTVLHPCANLWFARAIGFTHTGDEVYAHLDSVKADGWTCSIRTIQPIDYRAMRRDQQAARESRTGSG